MTRSIDAFASLREGGLDRATLEEAVRQLGHANEVLQALVAAMARSEHAGTASPREHAVENQPRAVADDAALDVAEDAADIADAEKALADPSPRIPHAVLSRIWSGTSPALAYREWRELSQKALADRIGVSQSTIRDIEDGTAQGRVPILARLATVFGVDIEDLVTDAMTRLAPGISADGLHVILRTEDLGDGHVAILPVSDVTGRTASTPRQIIDAASDRWVELRDRIIALLEAERTAEEEEGNLRIIRRADIEI